MKIAHLKQSLNSFIWGLMMVLKEPEFPLNKIFSRQSKEKNND